MTATERPSLEARAREWLNAAHGGFRTSYFPGLREGMLHDLAALLESVAAEERAFADTRLQTAVTTMEQATQAMLEARAEVVELRAALVGLSHGIERAGDFDDDTRVGHALKDAETALARPQPEAILRVLRAAVASEGNKAIETYLMDELDAAVRALPEGVREVLK